MQKTFTFSPGAWRPLLAGSLLVAGLGAATTASAQRVLWADAPQLPASARQATQPLSHFRAVTVQLDAVRAALQNAPAERSVSARSSATVISLPLPDGTSQRFRVVQVPVMAPALAAKYPSIRTYAAQGIDDPAATARLDLSPEGFHAMILSGGSTVYIDPAERGNNTHLVFERRAMNQGAFPFVCSTPSPDGTEPLPELTAAQRAAVANGTTLRTYRLALACTGEYSTFHGGTKVGAMAGMVASVNRVSGIYEKELAVRLVIVPKNDTLIFLDASTDPYTNSSGSAMLNQNQTTVDARIGSANYDIGHVFSTGGGGVAQKPSVCVSGKARGVTGSSVPTNDAFDVDYVAHEMGHQFGADHTFNSQTGSCGGGNRAAVSAYEPGSGTTIMAYAGICGGDDIQPNSDPYFHSRSFDQIVAHITGLGNCSVNTATGNTPPVVNAGRNYAIPISTPFVLTGSATDANNDALTYSWEQYNLGPAGAPAAATGDAPLFRVFSPTSSPVRTFPRLADILNNTNTRGELLPSYGRRLIFRLVARDNRVGGGGVDYDSMNVVIVPTAGPFVVTAPNTATSWLVGAPQQVTWNVANTTQSPINAATVDVLLSTDGGLTYPTTLLANTPNDGCETVTVPASVAGSTRARIRVQATGGIFFDVSNLNFTLEAPSGPTFFLQGPGCSASALAFCPGASGSVSVSVGQLQNFSGAVALSATNLPAGVTVTYASPTVQAGAGTTATVSATSAAAAGTYVIRLTGTSGGVTRFQDISLTVQPSATQAAVITAPSATAGPTTLRPAITWAAVPNATAYEVQIASDAAFTNVIQSQTNLTATSFTPSATLQPSTTYYVRVRGLSPCGTAPFSAVTAFTTGVQACQNIVATNVPRPIPAGSTPTVTSVIAVSTTERVSNIRISNLAITHPDVSELEISLTNPAGRRVVLFSRACPGTTNLNLTFDDAATAALACPLSSGATVRPANSLGDLLNSSAAGNWTLTISDNNTSNGGTLTGWTLELCTVGEVPAAPSSLTTLAPTVTAALATIDMIWLDNSGNETGFEIERARSGGSFAKIATVPANTTFYTDQVTANGPYCYRVRAVNTTGVSGYSNESCQTVAGITAVRNAALLQGIEVAPNPSAGVFNVRIDNAQRGSITLRVTDALGRQVQAQTLTKGAAALQLPLDLSALSTGVYTLHFDMPNGSTVVRLLKE
ncbi:reprolysin-like metallopeptidase [Hymenobacter metallilatus]|uniref:T9SS C-terminal target domain-containing protein n=1 Tax=Hymenobacter metallilatus TaxID=2493666 RepID=A0A3R9UN74_9BACT|nr:zinc-dependent metalloprotease family protein [Hymenobacter metallilatus]RSK35995.1 T9SS C-terminal target domain-containing protein [Hymenobacter metallilatus]